MQRTLLPLSYDPLREISKCLFVFASILTATFACGCGSSASQNQSSGMGLTGNTTVTVLASSTANDQLSQFRIGITRLTLTSHAGGTVTLLNAPISPEFIHVNGISEPLATVTVPQGVYTSAMLEIGNSQFACINLNSSGALEVSDFADEPTPTANVSVNLPAPITITGSSMGLLLNLLVSKSASYTTCDPSGVEPYSITPAFSVTPMTILAQPTNTSNGMLTGLDGFVASMNGAVNGFSVTAADGVSWQIANGNSTKFQGVSGVPVLAVGMPVDMDGVIRSDGSILATRVAVEDLDTANLTASIGPLLFVDKFGQDGMPYTDGNEFGTVGWGSLSTAGASIYSFSNAQFMASSAFTNLQNLPFPASFTAANMVAGQKVLITAHGLTIGSEPIYLPATTVTLLPQTINGTVSSISNEGGFTTYTVALASYDLFPELAVQQGQTTLLTNPGSVVVYVDNSTQLLNATNPIVAGSVLRFNGLIFNDNGTLRMDGVEVNDGVAE